MNNQRQKRMKTSLIVGMGIGNLYATVLNNLGHGVITVGLNVGDL